MKITDRQNTVLEALAYVLAAAVLFVEFGAIYVNAIKPLLV